MRCVLKSVRPPLCTLEPGRKMHHLGASALMVWKSNIDPDILAIARNKVIPTRRLRVGDSKKPHIFGVFLKMWGFFEKLGVF